MQRSLLTGVVLAAAAGIVALWWLRADVPRTTESNASKAESTPAAQAKVEAIASRASETNADVSPSPAQPATDTETPAKTDPDKPFRVDQAGKLILDEQTRLNMEALFAQTDAGGLPEAQQKISEQLPPAAAAEAVALLERYDNYSKAQRQAYPPGVAPATEEAALAELEGLHALRVAHFGAEAAKALYGNEEALTRSLIDLMRLEKDQGMTMEEKAARAQHLYDTRPELSRADRGS